MKSINHYIVSVSSANSRHFPDNNPSNFIHKLPSSIFLNPLLQHTITLTSILIGKIRVAGKSPGYVKICLKELTSHISGLHDENVLARVPLDKSRKGWYIPKYPLPILINNLHEINSLQYYILDEYDQQVLAFSPTTIIVNIREMELQDHFTIAVTPLLSKMEFPRNSSHRFRVVFPSPIILDDSWEVAVHSIAVPKEIIILNNSQKQVLLHSNIVGEAIFGDKLLPFMDVLLSKKIGFFDSRNDQYYELVHPIYHVLEKHEFSSLEIWFTDYQGSPITFNDLSDEGMTIILMFRKKL